MIFRFDYHFPFPWILLLSSQKCVISTDAKISKVYRQHKFLKIFPAGCSSSIYACMHISVLLCSCIVSIASRHLMVNANRPTADGNHWVWVTTYYCCCCWVRLTDDGWLASRLFGWLTGVSSMHHTSQYSTKLKLLTAEPTVALFFGLAFSQWNTKKKQKRLIEDQEIRGISLLKFSLKFFVLQTHCWVLFLHLFFVCISNSHCGDEYVGYLQAKWYV